MAGETKTNAEQEALQAQLNVLNEQLDEIVTSRAACAPNNSDAANRFQPPAGLPDDIANGHFDPNLYVPDFNIPALAPGGGDTKPEILEKLGPLAGFIGTWISNRFSGYNVMPLPQNTAPTGVILKNLFYYEVLTFSAIQGKVANRGGALEQDAYTIFYEQRVFFANGPQKDELVHAENGALLNLVMTNQGEGTLDEGAGEIYNPYLVGQQPASRQIVKQVSVPHGNSLLAMGSVERYNGAPQIPNVNTIPKGATKAIRELYGEDTPTNLNVNPNFILRQALCDLDVISTTAIHLDSKNHGDVGNIPFIQRHADVTQFTNSFWLSDLSDGTQQLQYTQNISLKFNNKDNAKYTFPHVTANTLFKVS